MVRRDPLDVQPHSAMQAPMHPIEPPSTGDPSRRRRRAYFGAAVLLVALWTARSYLAAVAWAIIIAVAIWPIYRRWPRGGGVSGLMPPPPPTPPHGGLLSVPP